MNLNEVIAQLIQARTLLEADDRDCDCVNVLIDSGFDGITNTSKIDLKDDGSGCDNLDVVLK